MKIYELGVEFGKRDDSCQYQLENTDNAFQLRFEDYVDGVQRIGDYFIDEKIHIIKGSKKCDFSKLWNGTMVYISFMYGVRLIYWILKISWQTGIMA